MAWKPRFNGNAQITKYTVEIKLKTVDWGDVDKKEVQTVGLHVTELRPASSYDLRVYATNKVGMSDASPVITASTLEAGKEFPQSACFRLVCDVKPMVLSPSFTLGFHLEEGVKELEIFEKQTIMGN